MPKIISWKDRHDVKGNRLCTGCRQYLPLDQFGKNRTIKDGLHVYCKACNTAKALEHYQRDPATANRKRTERTRAWRAANPSKVSNQHAARRRKTLELKRKAFDAYGGNCACCGESTFEFLSIDHINGGGHKHRQEIGAGYAFYRWLEKQDYPEGFQTLCFNCNLAKGFYGVCPHQQRKE